MFRVVSAHTVAPEVRRIELEVPNVARARQPGQFVIVRVIEGGERIPLTIADSRVSTGTIVIYVQAVGRTTRLLNALEAGDQVRDVVGPLGRPSRIARYGHVAVVGGGLGTAIAFPTAKALAECGNHVLAIIGARTREHLILEPELRAAGIDVEACTDDGSYGTPGFVTAALRAAIDEGPALDAVFVAGPVAMMRAVAEVTRPHRIPTEASLNPIMVDGTGMCGGCRVSVGGATKFACVDGPEFDAHLVDFDLLERRNQAYRPFEDTGRAALEQADIDRLLAPARHGRGETRT